MLFSRRESADGIDPEYCRSTKVRPARRGHLSPERGRIIQEEISWAVVRVVGIADLGAGRTRCKRAIIQSGRCIVAERTGSQMSTVVVTTLLPAVQTSRTAAGAARPRFTGSASARTTQALTKTAHATHAAQDALATTAAAAATAIRFELADHADRCTVAIAAMTAVPTIAVGLAVSAGRTSSPAAPTHSASSRGHQQAGERCDPSQSIHR